ncbi:hypothetical protein [Streptomyces sp. MMS24-I29]|uniref:hypothetical protein n=1 Tax=Streptomyces sp. MMS24-I29 TaxID=3351480 RepID=UPI003C7B5BA7
MSDPTEHEQSAVADALADEPIAAVALNEEQRHTVVGALYDKLSEIEHYLLSYRHDKDEPDALDSCCDPHLARYKERISQRDTLREQRALVEQTIQTVDGTELRKNEIPLTRAEVVAELDGLIDSLDDHVGPQKIATALAALRDRMRES